MGVEVSGYADYSKTNGSKEAQIHQDASTDVSKSSTKGITGGTNNAVTGSDGTSSNISDSSSNSSNSNSSNSIGGGSNSNRGGGSSVNTENSTTANIGGNRTHNSGSSNVTQIGGSTSNTVNSGRTDTSQLLLSETAVNGLVRNMLESNSGLANTVKGQNASGAYNTTTAAMLAGDLTSRVASEVASRSAITQNTIGGSSSSTVNSGSTNTQTIGESFSDSNSFSGSTSSGTNTGNSTNFNDGTSTNFNDTSGTSTASGSSKSSNTGTSSNRGFSDSTSTGFSNNDSVAELVHGATNGYNNSQNHEATTKVGVAAKGKLSVMCTELLSQGRLGKRAYYLGMRDFARYSPQSVKGYYYWAIPATNHMRLHPASKLTSVFEWIVVTRANHLTRLAEGKPATLKGRLLTSGMYALCVILSRTLARNYVYHVGTVSLQSIAV